jgi:hypothetical protein
MAEFFEGKKKYRVESVGHVSKSQFYVISSSPEPNGRRYTSAAVLTKGVDNKTPAWKAMCDYFSEQRAKFPKKKASR